MSRSFAGMVVSQWWPLPTVNSFAPDLSSKTVIVTGANIGLGFEAAKHIAKLKPARLILGCRDEKKAEEAVQAIRKATGYQNVQNWTLDLASFDSVKGFAERFAREGGGKLDILLENAAVATRTYRRTTDGFEQTVEVNHLSTALLAFRLLPYLLAAPEPRLAIVSSGVHMWVKGLDGFGGDTKVIEKLSDEAYCTPEVMGQRYPWSKLLNVFFARGLAAHLPPSTPLSIVTINPGLCHSALARELDSWFFYFYKLVLARTTEMGSRTLVHGAVSPKVKGLKGAYLSDCAVDEVSDLVKSEQGAEVQEKVWVETLDILSKADPEMPKIIKEYLS